MIAGLPAFQTEARGPGEIAFSRDGAGHVFPLHLMPGTSVLVREHQYLAATGNLDYTYQRVKGFANMMFGNSGFFVDQFTATQHEGVLCLHGYGNVFEKALAPGEQIRHRTRRLDLPRRQRADGAERLRPAHRHVWRPRQYGVEPVYGAGPGGHSVDVHTLADSGVIAGRSRVRGDAEKAETLVS